MGSSRGVAAWAFAAAGLGAAQGVATTAYGVMGLVATLPGVLVLAGDRFRRSGPDAAPTRAGTSAASPTSRSLRTADDPSGARAAIPNRPCPGHPGPMAHTTAQKSMSIPLTAFTAGAVVAVLVGVFGQVHDPTLAGTTTLGYSTVLAMKTVVATVIAVLAVAQVTTALWIYGKLGIRTPSWRHGAPRHRGHRAGAFVVRRLPLPVVAGPRGRDAAGRREGEHADAGARPPRMRRRRRHRGEDRRRPVEARTGWFLPVAGGILFSLLILAILTSAVWYIGEKGWPSQAG